MIQLGLSLLKIPILAVLSAPKVIQNLPTTKTAQQFSTRDSGKRMRTLMQLRDASVAIASS